LGILEVDVMKNIKVYLESQGILHSLYRNILNYPPNGVEYITDLEFDKKLKESVEKPYVKIISNVAKRIISTSVIKSYIARKKNIPKDVQLTYAAEHIVLRKEPWIVDLEMVTSLTGHDRKFPLYKRFIEKNLASKYCKKIMPWSEAAKETLLKNLNCQRFEHKIEVVNLAVPPKKFTKRFKNDKVRILFVGTCNPLLIKDSFRLKGGIELVHAFKKIENKYKDIELIIRSYIPDKYKKLVTGSRNIKVIDKVLPQKEYDNLFRTADIFIYPGHSVPGLAILDAMSYELPIIATDIWGNKEMVQDGVNGFLNKKAKNAKYFVFNGVPDWGTKRFYRSYKKIDKEMVNDIAKKMMSLIESPKLRRKMGKESRKIIEKGKYSIKERNKKLKRIYEEAAKSK